MQWDEFASHLAKTPASVLAARDTKSHSVLHTAVTLGNASVIELLLAAGADPNHSDRNGHTALHSIVFHLFWGRDRGKDEGDADETRTRTQAAKSCVLALRKGGADVRRQDKNGLTPVQLLDLHSPQIVPSLAVAVRAALHADVSGGKLAV